MSRLFRSRWAMLLWAAGVVWTAIEVAGAAPDLSPRPGNATTQTDATGAPINAADLAALAGAGG